MGTVLVGGWVGPGECHACYLFVAVPVGPCDLGTESTSGLASIAHLEFPEQGFVTTTCTGQLTRLELHMRESNLPRASYEGI